MTAISTTKSRRKITLGERDQRVVLWVWLLREARFADLCRLICPNCASPTPLRRSLARLVRSGYLIEKCLQVLGKPGRPGYCYIAGKAAVPLVARSHDLSLDQAAERQRDDERLSELFFPHKALVTEVRIALITACERYGYSLREWLSEEVFRSPNRQADKRPGPEPRQFSIVPDAFCVVDTEDRSAPLFIEAQNHSKPFHYAKKIHQYNQYIDSGAYTRELGFKGARILAVTDTRERAWHLKRLADGLPHARRFWSAAVGDIGDDALREAVWFVGGAAGCERLVGET